MKSSVFPLVVIFFIFIYLTIIPQARVGYEMVDSYNHLISNKGEWNDCFIKNAPQIELTKLKKNKNASKKITHTLTIFVEHGFVWILRGDKFFAGFLKDSFVFLITL